jgi:hypothetical protein
MPIWYSDRLRTGEPGFNSWQRQKSMVSRLALGPTQPPIRWVLGVLSPGVKLNTSAEIKNGGATIPTPLCVFIIV